MTRKVLTIVRSKWIRGGDPSTALLTSDGKMCCLGFDALACGFTEDQICYKPTPAQMVRFLPEGFELPDHYRNRIVGYDLGTVCNAFWVEDAIHYNDDSDLDDAEREELVRGALIKLGWDDVVFVD